MILISGPYSHKDPKVKEERAYVLSLAAAAIMQGGKIAFSPVVYGLSVIDRSKLELPDSTEFWNDFCVTFTSKAKDVWVLDMEGWQDSTGVKNEIKAAKENGITVSLIHFDHESLRFEFIKLL